MKDISTDYNWFKIAEALNELTFSAGGFTEVEVNNRKLCISRFKENLFACSATCPHAGGRLAEGYIDVLGNIVCPVHRYKFSLAHGRNTSGEGYHLRTFPVEIRDDGIFVGFKEKNFFEPLK